MDDATSVDTAAQQLINFEYFAAELGKILDILQELNIIVLHLKAFRPLIRVLVINDNGLWINDFI